MNDHEKVTVQMFKLDRTSTAIDRNVYDDYKHIDALELLPLHPDGDGDEYSATVVVEPGGTVFDPFHQGGDQRTDLIAFLQPVLELVSTEDLYAYFEARVQAEGMAAVAQILEA